MRDFLIRYYKPNGINWDEYNTFFSAPTNTEAVDIATRFADRLRAYSPCFSFSVTIEGEDVYLDEIRGRAFFPK
jgi:hypothetical protein